MDLFGKIENNSSNTQTVNLNAFSFNNSAAELDPTSGNLTIASANIYNNGNEVKVYGTNTLTLGSSSNLSGTGGLSIMAGATVIFQGPNTYNGGTTIKNGTLEFDGIGNANSSTIYVGDTSGSNSATLNLNGINQTYSSAVTVQSGNSGNMTINSLNASGTNILSNTITLNKDTTLSAANGGTLQVNTITGVSTANTLTIGGLGSVHLAGSVDNTNLTITSTSGTLVLEKTNSGPGGTGSGVRSLGGTLTVAGGLVQLGGTGQGGSTTSVDQIYDGASVVVNSGTFDLNGRSETINGFSGSGGTVTNTAGSTTATLTLGYNGEGGTYSGTMQDGGSGKVLALSKAGAGTIILSGANSYTGETRIVAGNLTVATGGTLGSGSNVFVSANATLNINTSTTVATAREAGTGDGGFIVLGSGATLTLNGANKGAFYQNSISGAGGLTMAGSGTTSLSLYNPQTYTGLTTVSGAKISTGVLMSSTAYLVSGGTFEASADNILSDTATMTLNSGTFSVGGTDMIGALSGTGGTISLASGKTLTTSFNSASNSFSGTINGAGALTKSGNGTLTLSGTNTYTGATSVTGGALVVNGSLASSSLSVDSGATLGGTGTIAGDTTIAGTHNPGNSPGIQTFSGNLTYSGGSSVNWELSANTTTNAANPNAIFDTVVVAGNLSFNGVTNLNLSFNPVGGNVIWSDPFWQTSKTGTSGWLIYDVTGSINIFSNLNLIAANNWQDSAGTSFNSVLGGSSFSLNRSVSGKQIYLDYTFNPVVTTPEPSSAVAMAVVPLLGGAVYMVRRRKVQI